ncbi:hypothetical protein [Pelomonas sp. Root1444]|uniref:hypothetical protein n=1 Tax=Pelomonas sp. Root1444 TaxID=1736464 RepID=UPI0007034027|nr:hypothetical protein [Pelomonas sp. Root1444]KQY80877.1 hypothetical protein ASD35_03245 [Pelomonas sp. Root1444]
MQLTGSWRKALMLVHLIGSLGWMGAIATYFALAAKGLDGPTEFATRAAYLGMQDVGWHVVMPLGIASVASGLVQALVTPWGVVRHAWIVVKLVISVAALGILLLHMGPTDDLAAAAAQGPMLPSDLRGLRLQLVWDSAAALVALVVAAALGTYKPNGQIAWARRGDASSTAAKPGRWLKTLMIATAVAAVFIIGAHLTGHSPHQH